MIEALLAAIWGIAVSDPVLLSIWGLDCNGAQVQPRFYLGDAPDEQAYPFVTYDLVKERDRGESDCWPMGQRRLQFYCYDFGPSRQRALQISERLAQLFSHRGYAVDPTQATSARTFEPSGPDRQSTGAKLVTCYYTYFEMRAYDQAAALAKVERDTQ